MNSALGFNEEQCKTIIEALIEMGYLYNFDDRLTSISVVRTFECVQATRISKRKYKDKYKSESVDIDKNEPKPIETDEMKSFNATADNKDMPLF